MKRRKFVKLYKEHRIPIYRYIYFRVNSKEEAEDLASEVFLRVFNYFKKNQPQNARAFFYKVARDLLVDFYRKNQRSLPEFELKAEDKHFLDLYHALSGLNADHREVVVLRYFEGFSIPEIAQITGKKEKNVEMMLYRSKNKLKDRL